MNRITIIGRLTREPERRTTANGTSVTTFSIAVNRRFDREKADFFNVVTWSGLADNCAKYLEKGQQAAVEGELQIRSYEAKDGTTRTVVEIQADNVEFLAKAGQSGAREASSDLAGKGDTFAEEMKGALVDDEDLPF